MVHGLILPKRPALSAAAYRKIWTERGSPLLFHLEDLTNKVQQQLGSGWIVKAGMRYGEPSLEKVLLEFKAEEIESLVVLPLYPQYSLAATESSVQQINKIAAQILPALTIEYVPPFYSESDFIRSFASVAQESLKEWPFDHVLMSFHGLPERQVKKTSTQCFTEKGCCEGISHLNQNCYRAQCYTTARLLATEMRLRPDQYTVCFQSRLGRTPWIQPYTDYFYRELPKQGVKRLAVLCPAFVADCLETLEEVQIRGKEEFVRNGGEDLKLVPSLNSSQNWAESVSKMILTRSEKAMIS